MLDLSARRKYGTRPGLIISELVRWRCTFQSAEADLTRVRYQQQCRLDDEDVVGGRHKKFVHTRFTLQMMSFLSGQSNLPSCGLRKCHRDISVLLHEVLEGRLYSMVHTTQGERRADA